MREVTVRPATLDDVAGIHAIYKDDDDGSPWSRAEDCAMVVNNLLLNGVLVTVAEAGGRILGHADYVLGEDPPLGRALHLSLLQVHPQERRRGIGTRLVEYGIEAARLRGCKLVTTHPEADAQPFYARLGFACLLEQRRVQIRLAEGESDGWQAVAEVPAETVGRLPLRLGRAQSSAYMWLLCNRDQRRAGRWEPRHPAFALGDAYIQFRYISAESRPPGVIAWASGASSGATLVRAAAALARDDGQPSFSTVIAAQDVTALNDGGLEVDDSGSEDFYGVRV